MDACNLGALGTTDVSFSLSSFPLPLSHWVDTPNFGPAGVGCVLELYGTSCVFAASAQCA